MTTHDTGRPSAPTHVIRFHLAGGGVVEQYVNALSYGWKDEAEEWCRRYFRPGLDPEDTDRRTFPDSELISAVTTILTGEFEDALEHPNMDGRHKRRLFQYDMNGRAGNRVVVSYHVASAEAIVIPASPSTSDSVLLGALQLVAQLADDDTRCTRDKNKNCVEGEECLTIRARAFLEANGYSVGGLL